MKKALIYIVVSLGIILLGWTVFIRQGKDAPGTQTARKPLLVDYHIVSYQNLSNEITVSGSVMAFDEVELKNEVAGRITLLHLPEGEFVKQGTLLVKLFDDDLTATLKNLENQLKIKELLYKRQEELLKVNGIGENEFMENGLAIEVLKSEIAVQKVKIRKTEIRAPFDGYIGLRNVSLGTEISTSTVLATIRTNQKLKLDFYVPEKYSAWIKKDMLVKFTMNERDSVYQASVIATEQGIDEATRSLKVRALITSSDPDIVPGAFAKVNLVLSENPEAILIPSRAIIPGQKNKRVLVARSGKAHFQEVISDSRQTSTVEIIQGLQIGDTVITSGLMMLKEGAELKYSSGQNPVQE